MSALDIVLLGPEHLDALAEIEAEVSSWPWSRQLFTDELSLLESSRHWLVGLSDGIVVGFAGVMFVESDAHLMNIAVRPDYHRRGIARKLLFQMISDVRRGGFTNMTLEVRSDNAGAIALYRQFGLAPGGIRKSYYADGQDALVLWVHDIDSPEYGQRLERMVQPC